MAIWSIKCLSLCLYKKFAYKTSCFILHEDFGQGCFKVCGNSIWISTSDQKKCGWTISHRMWQLEQRNKTHVLNIHLFWFQSLSINNSMRFTQVYSSFTFKAKIYYCWHFIYLRPLKGRFKQETGESGEKLLEINFLKKRCYCYCKVSLSGPLTPGHGGGCLGKGKTPPFYF
jgi:hypothetical protein